MLTALRLIELGMAEQSLYDLIESYESYAFDDFPNRRRVEEGRPPQRGGLRSWATERSSAFSGAAEGWFPDQSGCRGLPPPVTDAGW